MKQQQTGSVRDYKHQFKQLLSTVGRLSALHQLGCFASGLKGTLRTEVKAGRPKLVTKAILLVRLYETSNWSLKKPPIPDERRSSSKDLGPPHPTSPSLTQSNAHKNTHSTIINNGNARTPSPWAMFKLQRKICSKTSMQKIVRH